MLAEFLDKMKLMILAAEPEKHIETQPGTRTFYHGQEVIDPEPGKIDVTTLAGLIEVATHLLDRDEPLFGIVISDPTTVYLYGEEDRHRRRPLLAEANCPPRTRFPLENWMSQEDFVTMAQACFVPSNNLTKMLQVIGTLKAGRVTTYEDDGVTQQVQATAGIERVQLVDVPNPIRLAPYRTFIEIEQPTSEFVLRLRGGGENEKPKMGLYEVVDGEWRIDAMNDIKAHLDGLILADGDFDSSSFRVFV
jgi:hypothetical protein